MNQINPSNKIQPESLDIYHAIFKHFLDGIIGINEFGLIKAINPAAELVFGYSAEELHGKNISMLMPEPYRSEHDAYLKRYCSGGVAHIVGSSRQVTGQRKNGSTFPMELAVTEAIENNERVFLGSIRDLSTEKYYETSLQKAEENLRQSQQYAGVSHWHYDLVTKQMECSDNFKTIHGFDKSAANIFYLESLLVHTHPEDKNSVSDAFSRCLAGINQGEIETEYRVINAKGTFQWVELKGGVEKNTDGQPIFIHGVARDISKRKNTESRSIALGNIIDQAQIEIYIINMATFKFLEVNKLARDNLGYTLNELQQLTPLDIKKELKAEDFYQILAPLYSQKSESVNFESKHYRRDGSSYPVEVKLQFMTYSGQEVCIAFVEDISIRQAIMKQLYDASHAKTQFLSRMSHELRTPLNAILGFSQLLELDQENALDEDQSENVAEIFKAGTHLLELINDVLDLSKIEAGKTSIAHEPLDLKELASNVQQLLEPIATKQEITFINDIKTPLCLLADTTRTTQVLINLISNAIKYNKEKGSITLKSKLSDDAQFIRIEVKDSGVGLTEEQIKNIFNPFERLGAETTDIEGTGVGLTLTKELVQLMGGDIGVTSQKGVGSCFWFTLPLLQKKACESCWKINHTVQDKVSQTHKDVSQIDEKSIILYIEDNLANLKLVKKVVKNYLDYTFLSAPDVETGLQLAKTHKPKLVLMDIHLPLINGIEGKKMFSADKELQHIPVVAVSASAMQVDINQAMDVGFKKYITKPVDVTVLTDTIKQFINV